MISTIVCKILLKMFTNQTTFYKGNLIIASGGVVININGYMSLSPVNGRVWSKIRQLNALTTSV